MGEQNFRGAGAVRTGKRESPEEGDGRTGWHAPMSDVTKRGLDMNKHRPIPWYALALIALGLSILKPGQLAGAADTAAAQYCAGRDVDCRSASGQGTALDSAVAATETTTTSIATTHLVRTRTQNDILMIGFTSVFSRCVPGVSGRAGAHDYSNRLLQPP
jgi:hypothetical protein